jgi:diketogulonate reductase-like aldo/keto reductase
MSLPTVKLSNGLGIPIIGLGTFLALNPQDLIDALKVAVEAGYRHFDCGIYCFIYLEKSS